MLMTKKTNAVMEQTDLKIRVSLVNQGGITTRSGPLIECGFATHKLKSLE